MHKEMMGDLLYEQEGIKVSGREKTASELMKLAIFTAEDEKFAFKRAVSRLKEMQSVSYWAQTHAPVPSEFAGLNSMNQPDVSSNNEEKGPTGSTVVSKGDDPLKDAPPRFTDDFGDEASYTGYLKQFQRFSPTSEPGRDPIMDTFKLKEDSKPKFKENHFWSVGDASSWGKKAGKWGEGVAALFSLDKKGRKGSGEGKGDQ
jgi:protein AFG1